MYYLKKVSLKMKICLLKKIIYFMFPRLISIAFSVDSIFASFSFWAFCSSIRSSISVFLRFSTLLFIICSQILGINLHEFTFGELWHLQIKLKIIMIETSSQAPRCASCKADKLKSWKADKLTSWQAHRLTNSQSDKLKSCQTDKMTGWKDGRITI